MTTTSTSYIIINIYDSRARQLNSSIQVRPWWVQHHDDVIKWKHFPRYWPFVRGIHRSPVNSPHKGQWRGALMFSLICVWINGWVNNRKAGDLIRYRAHYDVIVMGNLNTMVHDMLKCTFFDEICYLVIKISLIFLPESPIGNTSPLVRPTGQHIRKNIFSQNKVNITLKKKRNAPWHFST